MDLPPAGTFPPAPSASLRVEALAARCEGALALPGPLLIASTTSLLGGGSLTGLFFIAKEVTAAATAAAAPAEPRRPRRRMYGVALAGAAEAVSATPHPIRRLDSKGSGKGTGGGKSLLGAAAEGEMRSSGMVADDGEGRGVPMGAAADEPDAESSPSTPRWRCGLASLGGVG